MPLTGEPEIVVLPVGDYVVPLKMPTVRHCVDCITNPVVPENPDATERSIRCEPCEFKHLRRGHGAKRATWQGSSWPDEEKMAHVRAGKEK